MNETFDLVHNIVDIFTSQTGSHTEHSTILKILALRPSPKKENVTFSL